MAPAQTAATGAVATLRALRAAALTIATFLAQPAAALAIANRLGRPAALAIATRRARLTAALTVATGRAQPAAALAIASRLGRPAAALTIATFLAQPAAATTPMLPPSPDLATLLPGNTIATMDPQHGTQVEYFRPDGTSLLWYPGMPDGMPGEWAIRGGGQFVCFTYQTEPPGGWPTQPAGIEDCQSARIYVPDITSIARGDPLRLGDGTVPFLLTREGPPDIPALTRMAGLPGPVQTLPTRGQKLWP